MTTVTPMTTVTTKPTLFRPATIGLRAAARSDYRSRVALGSRLEWEPNAGCLDWAALDGLDAFYVRIRYAEYIETRQKSDNESYDGRRDYRRVPNGRGFGRTICKVRRGRGDHIVRIKDVGGNVLERIVPEDEVIPTVRLFVSTQYVRRGLDIQVAEYGQLGANIVKDSVRMIIQPVEG